MTTFRVNEAVDGENKSTWSPSLLHKTYANIKKSIIIVVFVFGIAFCCYR